MSGISFLCRAEGKIYAVINIEHDVNFANLRAYSIVKDGILVPVTLIPSSSTYLSKKYIAVIFEMRVNQSLIICEQDEDGDERILFSKVITPIHSRLVSKINGLLFSKKCETIRRIDNYRSLQQFTIAPVHFVPVLEGGWLLIVGVSGFNFGDDDLNVEAVSSNGDRVPFKWFPLQSVALEQNEIEERALALRIDERCRSLCVAVRSSDEVNYSTTVFSRQSLRMLSERFKAEASDAFTDKDYEAWFMSHKVERAALALQENTGFIFQPMFSIVVPLFKTPDCFFIEMVESVLAQSYKKWELVLVNASPQEKELCDLISAYSEVDGRIVALNLDCNYGITENTNRGVSAAKGDYICFFDHDDVLEPNILYEYAKAINANPNIGLLYCDEDKLYPNGIMKEPSFKPDFNLYLLRDNNYICHLLTVKRSLLGQIETPAKDLDGAQDHSLTLQIAESGAYIHHVPKVLYHWRVSENSTASNADSKPYATEAGIRAVQRHLARCDIHGSVECSHGRSFRYKIDYSVNPAIEFDVLLINNESNSTANPDSEGCIEKLAMSAKKVIYVSRNSLEKEKELNANIEYYAVGADDSWSSLVNFGVDHAESRYILVIDSRNNAISDGWEKVLFGILSNDDVAISTPMFCDACGITQGVGSSYARGCIISPLSGLPSQAPGYLFRALSTQEVTAPHTSCFALDKVWFEELGGFENEIINSDEAMMDFCLRLREKRMKVVYSPEVEVRSAFIYKDHLPRVPSSVFMKKWGDAIKSMDPYLNSNLSALPERVSQFKIDVLSV